MTCACGRAIAAGVTNALVCDALWHTNCCSSQWDGRCLAWGSCRADISYSLELHVKQLPHRICAMGLPGLAAGLAGSSARDNQAACAALTTLRQPCLGCAFKTSWHPGSPLRCCRFFSYRPPHRATSRTTGSACPHCAPDNTTATAAPTAAPPDPAATVDAAEVAAVTHGVAPDVHATHPHTHSHPHLSCRPLRPSRPHRVPHDALLLHSGSPRAPSGTPSGVTCSRCSQTVPSLRTSA